MDPEYLDLNFGAQVPPRSHLQTLMHYKLGFNQNFYTFTMISLIKIVLRSKFPWSKFMNYQCFDMRSAVIAWKRRGVHAAMPFCLRFHPRFHLCWNLFAELGRLDLQISPQLSDCHSIIQAKPNFNSNQIFNPHPDCRRWKARSPRTAGSICPRWHRLTSPLE